MNVMFSAGIIPKTNKIQTSKIVRAELLDRF